MGCFVGTFLYSVFQSRCYIVHLSFLEIEKLSTKSSRHAKTVMELTGLDYRILAVVFAVAMYFIVFVVELFVPWRKDVHTSETASLVSYAWSPVFSGVIIGLLQLPLNGLLGKIIGTSISYMTLLSQVYDKSAELKCHKHNWWQVWLVGGSVAGSYLSSYLYMGSWNVYNASVQGAKPLWGFIGGVLLLLGAKTMRACTSGHGLSGMPLMAIPSIVATCCIFAGGIATGILVNRSLSSVCWNKSQLHTTL